jgi:hypothetical protein
MATVRDSSITKSLASHPMFLALAEAVRWWLYFDGPQTLLCQGKVGPMLTRTDVRRIALNYNFARNLSEKDKYIDAVAEEINRFSGKRWPTLDARAAETEKAIRKIRSVGGTKFRVVSGTTKLTWFVNPTDWTPFDRLAASAVGVREIDLLARMRGYYRALDERGFLGTALRIRAYLDPEGLGKVGGERVLDKLLMMAPSDDKSAQGFRLMARAFAESLPSQMKENLIRAGEAIISDPGCHFKFGS